MSRSRVLKGAVLELLSMPSARPTLPMLRFDFGLAEATFTRQTVLVES